MMTKRSLILASMALLMVVGGVTALAADGDEDAVKKAELHWAKSQQTNNVDLIAPLFADKIVETNGEGKVFAGKEAVLADGKSQTWTSVSTRI